MRFIEALEGRSLFSGVTMGQEVVPLIKAAIAKPAAKRINLVGNFNGEFAYPKFGTGATLWAMVSKQANGVVTLRLGSYHRFDYPVTAAWNAAKRTLSGSYKGTSTVQFNGTVSVNGSHISGKFSEKYQGKSYAGTFSLDRVNYDPR